MPFLDKISDLAGKFAPSKSSKFMAGGIGSGHGMVPIDDDRQMGNQSDGQLLIFLIIPVLWLLGLWMIVSKPAIVAYSSQIFFNLIAMICFAAVASFQAKWDVGPSGLTGFALFISIASMLLSAFMLSIPVVCEKHDKFVGLARALKEVRIGFILTGTGLTFSLLIAFIVTISAWTESGCKNAKSDPNAESKGDDFVNGLPGWCTTKKSGAIFFWLAFVCWSASMAMFIMDWRSGKLIAARDPPFTRPQVVHEEEGVEEVEAEEEEEDASHSHLPPLRQSTTSSPPNVYANPNSSQSPFADRYSGQSQIPASTPLADRRSMDTYGAFSDPAPSGFGTSQYNQVANYATTPNDRLVGAPVLPELNLDPTVSRTMQYADPYTAVRWTIAQQQQQPQELPPPRYDNTYEGYR